MRCYAAFYHMSSFGATSPLFRPRYGPPRNGDEKVEADRDGIKHLEYFMNGSWRHSQKQCRTRVNPQCER